MSLMSKESDETQRAESVSSSGDRNTYTGVRITCEDTRAQIAKETRCSSKYLLVSNINTTASSW